MKTQATEIEKLHAELAMLKEEVKIEASLEKVRARSMAMQKSDELISVATVLNQELINLGIRQSAHSSFVLVDEANEAQYLYGSQTESKLLEYLTLPLFGDQSFQDRFDAWKLQKPIYSVVLAEQELRNHLQVAMPPSKITKKEKESQQDLPDPSYFYFANFKQGYLQILTSESLNNSAQQILIRFAQVFGQSYTRFLDLQKAEEQARKAEIEVALERVRSKSIAMHKSEELADVVALMYTQIQNLGFTDWGCAIILCDEKNSLMRYWYADIFMSHSPEYFNVPLTNTTIKKTWKLWKQGTQQFTIELLKKKKDDYTEFMLTETDHVNLPDEVKDGWRSSENVYFSYTNIKYGLLEFTDVEPFAEENFKVYQLFAKVFEQTYTRFLDLKKAEAQAREAQIEAALERVRGRTMAMQNSEELAFVVQVINDETRKLDLVDWGCNIQIMDGEANQMELWIAETSNELLPKPYYFKNRKIMHPAIKKQWEAYANRNKQPHYTLSLEGSAKESYDDYVFEFTDLKNFPDDIKEGIRLLPKINFNMAFMKYGSITVINSSSALREDQYSVLGRFAHVFEQTYTRFLDLQKAEAQAREAQIEAALEKVRSASMSMHKSDDMMVVVNVLFEQIKSTGIHAAASWVVLTNLKNETLEYWIRRGSQKSEATVVHVNDSIVFKEILESFRANVETLNHVVPKTEFFPVIHQFFGFNLADRSDKENTHLLHTLHKYGYIGVDTWEEATNEEKGICRRFTKVFEQTYTRFLDLQKAEEQAKEAIKQASLDRVRGEIASMRSTSDLDRITPLIWNELTTLGVPFIRCGVSIIHEDAQNIEMFLSTPDGSSLAMMNLDFDSSELTQNSIEHWRKNKVYHQHWSKEEFINWTNSLVKDGKIKDNKAYQGAEKPPETLDLYFVPFTQGSLYVGAVAELADEEIELVKSLADAFSIAYARYEDFVKLEKAKESIEATLSELKSTQAQLIQSEKMASLGELTAGIAHEIQNPLNFVNNFSEVSRELAEELKEELEKGDVEEAKFISEDLVQNLSKINHHGQRASSIVKGMLEHSRTSSGKKELTDINALADEYLRLSYHGLRAKDKSFNADFKTDFDPALPKIKVVQQDIGRVLLNLINNAFQAVSEEGGRRKEQGDSDYQPLVSVATQLTTNSNLQITITDNGPGIPDETKDKIFQPFFTTKPTGKGTGLGLSLAYDIVKAHGGELEFESTKNEATSFIIILPRTKS